MTDDAITSNDDLPPPCPPILLGIRAALGQSLLAEILSSKILLIGSGGIGCELLKNLALSGFRHVEVVDLDTIDVSEGKRYIHHYNFPPFCTGETGFMRVPKRREIGHGALAERSVEPVIPADTSFPYTITFER